MPAISKMNPPCFQAEHATSEPVFVNNYGAQESIPRDRFRQPMQPGGPVRQIGMRTGPPGWESISGLLEGSTNTGSAFQTRNVQNREKGRGATGSYISLARGHEEMLSVLADQ
jgi:hypothetical protein